MANIFGMESRWVNREPAVATPMHLTPRQLDVLALLCEGLPNKLIGRQLNIASATVKIHIAAILRALNVSSRLQAAIVARRLDLIDEPAFAGRAEREPFSRAMQPVAMHVAWNGNNSSLPVAADRSLAEAVA